MTSPAAQPASASARSRGTPPPGRRSERHRSSAPRPRRRRRAPRGHGPPSPRHRSCPPRSAGVADVDVAGPPERGQAEADPADVQRGSARASRPCFETLPCAAMRLSILRPFTAIPCSRRIGDAGDQRAHPGGRARSGAAATRARRPGAADRRSPDRAGDRGRRDAGRRLRGDDGRDRAARAARRVRRGPRRVGRARSTAPSCWPGRRPTWRRCTPTASVTRASSACASCCAAARCSTWTT